LVLGEGQLLLEVANVRPCRILGRKSRGRRVAKLLRDELADSDFESRLNDGFHRRLVVRVDDVVERARGSGTDLFERAEIGCNPKIFDTQLSHQREGDLVQPWLEQQPFARVLEKTGPVMVMAVDEPGDDDHATEIDVLDVGRKSVAIEAFHFAEVQDFIVLDADPAVANDVSCGIYGDDIAVRQKE
jgi:hypothetical protein